MFYFNTFLVLTRQLNPSFPAKGIGIFDRPQCSGKPSTQWSFSAIRKRACDYWTPAMRQWWDCEYRKVYFIASFL